jgi:hypothetical protein
MGTPPTITLFENTDYQIMPGYILDKRFGTAWAIAKIIRVEIDDPSYSTTPEARYEVWDMRGRDGTYGFVIQPQGWFKKPIRYELTGKVKVYFQDGDNDSWGKLEPAVFSFCSIR